MQDINSISNDNNNNFSPQEEVFTKKLVTLLFKQLQKDLQSKNISTKNTNKQEDA